MRLSPEHVAAIKEAAAEAFGPDAVVRLFGSRADDARRGGDIDLHVEASPDTADLDHEVRFRALVWRALDEEQVDVVVAARRAGGTLDRPRGPARRDRAVTPAERIASHLDRRVDRVAEARTTIALLRSERLLP